jgi:hypothetical protein
VEQPDDPVMLALRGGESLPAAVRGYDGKVLQVETSWGGTFAVPWGQVARLEFTGGPGTTLFAGPAPGQDWRFLNRGEGNESEKSGRWALHDDGAGGGRQGGAAVDLRLPDQATIELDVQWSGQLNFGLGLFADSFQPDDKPDGPTVFEEIDKEGRSHPHREAIALEVNSRTISLQVHSNDDQDHVGHARLTKSLHDQSEARFTLRADRLKGVLALWVNGDLVQRWEDVGPFPGKGGGISLWQYHDAGQIRVRRLVARQWNGLFDDEAPRAESKKDIVVGTDGSRISGRLTGLADGKWRVSAAAGELSLALAETRHVVAAKAGDESSAPAGTKIWLEGGAQLVLEEFGVAGGRVAGRHHVLGPVAIAYPLVKRVQFEPRPESGPAKP